jgi:hypothetical protein
MTYFKALYFCYISLLTIGYGKSLQRYEHIDLILIALQVI